MKKIVVFGVFFKLICYFYVVVQQLIFKGYEVVFIGVKDGEIDGIEIIKGILDVEDVYIIMFYLSFLWQVQYYDYIFSFNFKWLIFNFGMENLDFI